MIFSFPHRRRAPVALACSVACSCACLVATTSARAQVRPPDDATPTLSTVTVDAAPDGPQAQPPSLRPAKVLIGDELQDKMSGSLGDTLSHELGVTASAFGAAASRPIIRGQEGPRVQIMENGMGVADVSSISNDHAVASEFSTASKIEILRGPAALLYGSGASGGLVNIINDKIATELPDQMSAVVDTRYSSADNGRQAGVQLDTPSGPLAIHLDASMRNADDYTIPGYREQGGPTANWPINGNTTQSGTLPHSFSDRSSVGLGLSYIRDDGYTGVSVEQIHHKYGIPSFDGSQIDQTQNRLDLQHYTRAPLQGFDSLKFKLAYTDYQHQEQEVDGTPATQFYNRAVDARIELAHAAWAGWTGTLGGQVGVSHFSATDLTNPGHAAVIPPTDSRTAALFAVEQRSWGALTWDWGARLDNVARTPDGSVPYTDTASFTTPGAPSAQNRSFNLWSWSTGLLWALDRAHSAGITYSVAQRAPAAEELYSYGAHDATVTFDVGNSSLQAETAHNLELSLQRTVGLVQWRADVFQNQVSNYIYGTYPGEVDSTTGYQVRQFVQADATIRGAEAELTYNWHQPGYSARTFFDTARGTLDAGGSLPLQAATRLGVEGAYAQGAWRSSLSVIHALQQTQLASFETDPTPEYTQVDAAFSLRDKFMGQDVTWYLQGRNLLNEDIRYSTTVEALRLYAPQMGRSLIIGARFAL